MFDVAGCKILVEGHPGVSPPRIDLAVDGLRERRRAALQVMLNHFDHVHELNLECNPQARVPLPDSPELDVSFDHLLKLEELEGGEHKFLPEGASRRYSVKELLSGVRHEQRERVPPRSPEPADSTKAVFVSYSWNEASRAIVDQLESAFHGRDIRLLRDKNEMNYRQSIHGFMRDLGRGKCIVVVISKDYLESDSCMFELTEIAARGDMRDRVFPIVLDDARLLDHITRLRYIKHWERKKAELDAEMKGVGSENLEGIREAIDLYTRIRTTLARIIDILGDMNTLTPEQHRGTEFETLFNELESKLSS